MFTDSFLENIDAKVRAGERITEGEGIRLFKSTDILGLGRIADRIKRQKNGDRVTYVVNRQINPTNICVLDCKFCDFGVRKDSPKAYLMTLQDILSKLSDELREVHIVGGLYGEWKFADYQNIVSTIHQKFPKIQIKAYTAVEIDFFARKEKCTTREILMRLKDAGLNCLPGGGAEVLSERVHKELFHQKIGAEPWLRVHKEAHELGIRSNATMLYGHIETYEERVEHLMKLRNLQDQTKGFLSFIPLAFQVGDGRIVKRQASAMEDLKMIAVSRIFLDNFDHIKSYWVTMGEEIASISLHMGADDLDGTIGEEKIMHAAEAASPVKMAKERLEFLIRSAGQTPIERDTLYETVGA